LNLALSCLAALQAPVIIMSQNRQAARDRLDAQHDYEVNTKAEMEIKHRQFDRSVARVPSNKGSQGAPPPRAGAAQRRENDDGARDGDHRV